MKLFKKRKYRLNNNDRIEDLALRLFIFIFLSYGFFIAFFGAFFNIGVIINNEGRMPVMTECPISTQTHFSFQEKSEVNYWLLSDVVKISTPFIEGEGYISIGDLMILFGFLFSLFSFIHFSFKVRKFNKRIKKKYGS